MLINHYIREIIEKFATIVAARIDGRSSFMGKVKLIFWELSKLNISRIMVVLITYCEYRFRKTGLKLATPAGVKLSILTEEKRYLLTFWQAVMIHKDF